jgi:hypothetical protein
MQIIKSVRSLLLFLLPLSAFAQSSYIHRGTKDEILLDRLEIKSLNHNLNFSNTKPYNRRLVTKEVEMLDSLQLAGDAAVSNLTEIDKYNMQRFLMNNSEWSKPREAYLSERPIFKEFYKTRGNFYEMNTKDFFFVFNPVLQYQVMKEKGNPQHLFYNSRGVSIRGMIGRKVGVDIYVTDNQERDPLYVQERINDPKYPAVPGARFFKSFKAPGGVDYFDNRASVSINASKYIDIQLGYDRNFIGDGFRSLLMSDFAGNAMFLKLNTRIWKFNYQNLFMELIPQGRRAGGNTLLPRKYFRMNYLTINATPWLNLGLFDAVMFGRKDHFDFQYLIPVLFLRPAESDIGSKDNAIVGLTAKANVKRKFQLYSQLMLDEFIFREIVKNTGSWRNKFGYQLGVKYPDAFKINNLDLQVETNRVRPFTYSHFDSVAEYSHYNQPFAHPLGANFQEYIAIAKYQPLRHVYLQARAIYFRQGLDTMGQNLGSNILRSYNTRPNDPATGRPKEFGYFVGETGNTVKSLNINLLASYELRENMFIDANLQRRSYDREIQGKQNTTVVSIGIRWNMARRDFDF